ncbi:MAG: dihydroorotate dehydrogenase [Candidatus Nitrosopumilus limneticus]|nr:C catalytic subunit [Candidatus Nitrosopumilus limneticus]MDC4212163.1 dihydroorotate dehydrogenase [Candidatus Nitrosopumilus limneticus]MDC4213825.1 dihydroorotate dehydrogenase [Candidatus Nitrosopumilus limneticus]MDC4215186.1 dihydroorotate dehydrogenase [Candidatus Nitrosopumilus limneticus]MDC4216009.1 dihydroorotate dehydrogenase [Candidatus Nitrosopumilus limneticus]
MVASLATSIGKIHLDKPAMLASGVLGISLDVFNRLYRSGAGAVVTKSLSTEPWEGYPNPTIFSVDGGGWMNAVGLSNPGASNFAKMIEHNQDVPIIVSLVGSIPEDFKMMINEFENCNVTAFELNLSCPHVAKVGLEVGDDPELVKKIVSTVKNSTNVPVIAKVGLGTTHYLNTVKTAIDSGIDAITAINTVRAMAIDVETQRPILSNKFGGLSGTPIKPIAIRCVYEISSKYNIPIIGCGGISTWEDAIEFFLAGASAIQIGSAIGDNWISVFDDINKGVLQYMKQKNYSTINEMVGLAKKF